MPLSTKNIRINASNRGEKASVYGNLAGDQISKAGLDGTIAATFAVGLFGPR